MNPVKYRNFDVWKRANELAVQVYKSTENFPSKENFGLTQQIRRAGVSVLSNIAEGCGRFHTKDTLQFLYIAKGSLYEVEAQMYLAYELSYISKEELGILEEKLLSSKQVLWGFIKHHRGKL